MSAPAALRFAPLLVRALDGTRRDLPHDLPARRTLVLLAYRQRYQRDVDAWIALVVAHGVAATPRGAAEPLPSAVVEVPYLSSRWLPLRRFIDGGMATGIADPDVLARTWTAYGSPARHRRACGLVPPVGQGGRAVEAVVVDRAGTVFWHATGPPPRDLPDGLRAALDGR